MERKKEQNQENNKTRKREGEKRKTRKEEAGEKKVRNEKIACCIGLLYENLLKIVFFFVGFEKEDFFGSKVNERPEPNRY